MEEKEIEKLDKLRCDVADFTLVRMEEENCGCYDYYVLININDYYKAKGLYYDAYNEWTANSELKHNISLIDYVFEHFRNNEIKFMYLGQDQNIDTW